MKNFVNSVKHQLLFFLLAGTCLQAKAQWYMIGSWDLPIPNTGGWEDVFFLNKDTGFVVGGIATPNGVNIGEQVIIRTHNGGLSWDTTWFYSINQVLHRLEAIHCPNDSVCFAVGTKDKLYKTTDGGDTWTWSNPAIYAINGDPPDLLNDVFFINNDIGYTCHANSGGSLVARTTDGGLNWITDSVCGGALAFSFPNDSIGYTNFACKTTDGGNSWNYANTLPHENYPQFNSYKSVSFLNEKFGFIASSGKDGFDYGYPSFNFGIVSITKDGGNTWVNKEIPLVPQIQTILICNDNKGYFGCPPNLSLNSIFSTEDGGDNWYPQELVGKNILNYYPDIFSIHCPNDSVCYAVGRYQYIYKTTNGGGPLIGVGVKENKEEKAFTVYPNPSVGLLNVQIKENTEGYINLLNSLGSLIKQWKINPEEQLMQIDIESFAPGLYFLQVQTAEEVQTVKFVKQ